MVREKNRKCRNDWAVDTLGCERIMRWTHSADAHCTGLTVELIQLWQTIPHIQPPFPYLQTAIKRSLDGDALGGMRPVGGDGGDQAVQFITLLLQLLHQALDGSLGEALALPTLSVAHEAMHDAEAGIGRRGRLGRHGEAFERRGAAEGGRDGDGGLGEPLVWIKKGWRGWRRLLMNPAAEMGERGVVVRSVVQILSGKSSQYCVYNNNGKKSNNNSK